MVRADAVVLGLEDEIDAPRAVTGVVLGLEDGIDMRRAVARVVVGLEDEFEAPRALIRVVGGLKDEIGVPAAMPGVRTRRLPGVEARPAGNGYGGPGGPREV